MRQSQLARFKTVVEWILSGLCLVGAVLLWVQQEGWMAIALLGLGLGFNPILNVNPLLKVCFTLMAWMVLLSR